MVFRVFRSKMERFAWKTISRLPAGGLAPVMSKNDFSVNHDFVSYLIVNYLVGVVF